MDLAWGDASRLAALQRSGFDNDGIDPLRLRDVPTHEKQSNCVFFAPNDLALTTDLAVSREVQSEFVGDLDAVVANQLGSRA
jgi:hypothetical protein